MLTPEQIAYLRDRAGRIADPISEFLIQDIAMRIADAGQLTSTAAYQVWRAQNLGLSQQEIKKRLGKELKKSQEEIERLLTQAAEVGYNFDLSNLPTAAAISFVENESLQQLVAAAVRMAQEDFTNLTQTLGMVDPYGNALPLQEAYRKSTDYAFEQVFTGATDYNTAIRQATKHLAEQGVRVIDYESGVHTSLEAAVRRNIMGGLGLMQEQISKDNHDQLGADGWEISAHAASAPDHEPIQGRQYSDKAYQALNNSLTRRIGTLNCGHAAFPIILGVSSPQYTAQELRKFQTDNTKGVGYEGRHYTMYEATQKQRQVERAIRRQKNRILVSEATGDEEKLLTARIRLARLNQEYTRFSKATGLRTQRERALVEGFGRGHAKFVAKPRSSGMIESKEASKDVEESVKLPQYRLLGKIRTDYLEAKFGKLQTDELIVMSEREAHIKQRHPQDFELFQKYGAGTVKDPDLVFTDEKNQGTVFMVHKLEDTNLNVVVRVALETDTNGYKNSIMTFYRIRDRNLKKLVSKNEILYRKE